jgi:hypothetical protein
VEVPSPVGRIDVGPDSDDVEMGASEPCVVASFDPGECVCQFM